MELMVSDDVRPLGPRPWDLAEEVELSTAVDSFVANHAHANSRTVYQVLQKIEELKLLTPTVD